jgi:hypothetical protein
VDPRSTIYLPSVGILPSDFGTAIGMHTCSRHLQNTRRWEKVVPPGARSHPPTGSAGRHGYMHSHLKGALRLLWRSDPLLAAKQAQDLVCFVEVFTLSEATNAGSVIRQKAC